MLPFLPPSSRWEHLRADGRIPKEVAMGLSLGKLILKVRRERTLLRACFCESFEEDLTVAHILHPFYPVYQIWPRIKAKTTASIPWFPTWNGDAVLTKLRGFGAGEQWRGNFLRTLSSSREQAVRLLSEEAHLRSLSTKDRGILQPTNSISI